MPPFSAPVDTIPHSLSPCLISSSKHEVLVEKSLPSCNLKKQPSTMKRRVRFATETDVQEAFLPDDVDEDELADAMWYSKDEYRHLKKIYYPTLKKMAKGIPLDEGDEEPRGLEHKTPKGNKRRQRNRYLSLDAVFGEQDRQWESGRSDPDFIARVYSQSTAHCMLHSYEVANGDAEYVTKHVRGGL